MRKIPLYAVIVALSLVTVMAHAQVFFIHEPKARPAVTLLPRPRPKNLVRTKHAAAKAKVAEKNTPVKTAKAKTAGKIIWDKTAPAKKPVKAAAAKKAPAKPAKAKMAAAKIIWDKAQPVKQSSNKQVLAKTKAVKAPAAKTAAKKPAPIKTTETKTAAVKKTVVPKAVVKTVAAKTAPAKAADANVKSATAAVSKNSPFYNPDANPPPIVDVDETLPLPPYPPHAITSVGTLKHYTLGAQDTLLDAARYFNIGYVEMRAANPGVDPWTPVPGSQIVIPSFKLIPRTPYQKGIIVNLAQMRLFYFKTRGKPPVTYPIGIGRDGLSTPTGHTTIISKKIGPYWFPTPRMREEEPFLPAAVPPGPNNPLGSRALYLGWPEYRIHGTNLPWAVGRSVSSGCMRMYARDILRLYNMVPVGTNVTVVNQPILVGWVGPKLYLEADPSKTQNVDIEITGTHKIKPLTPGLKKVIIAAAGHDADKIDWTVAKQVVAERLGYPVMIANLKGAVMPPHKAKAVAHRDMVVPSVVARYDFNQ